jgi:hypothetical protein
MDAVTVVERAATNRTPISAEARGLARDFCRRVRQEATRLNEQTIGAPLRRRIERYPDRRPREGMLRDLEFHWRNAQPQQFRLHFRCTWQGKDVFMIERAVTVLNAFRLPHWDANDYGVEVVDTWLEVSRRRVDAGLRSRMWIGSHALARWYQRSGARSDAQLLHDIDIGAAFASSDRKAFADLDHVRVPIGATSDWRGAMMVAPEAESGELVFYVKTFV